MTSQKLSKDLQKAQENFDKFDEQVKTLTSDLSQNIPTKEREQQTELSTRQIDKDNGIYLKPERTIGSKEKFNEEFRKDYDYLKEPVRFIAENYEIVGESIEIWTKKFPGIAVEFWRVPTNKVVVGPRYLAEQISSKSYCRLKMEESSVTSQDGPGTFIGQLVASHKVQRLDARPAQGFNRNSKFG